MATATNVELRYSEDTDSVLTKLENEGYRASKKKSKFYQKNTI